MCSLEISSDAVRFCIYASVAEFAIEKGQIFAYGSISDAAIEILQGLDLHNIYNATEWAHALRGHIERMHGKMRYRAIAQHNLLGT